MASLGDAIVNGISDGIVEEITGTSVERSRFASAQLQKEMTTDGLEPVGPVAKPGYSGIEVIGYAEKAFISIDTNYYMAIRNNNSSTKLVEVRYIGGRRLYGKPLSGTVALKIAAGDIHTWHIDYAESRPSLVEVIKCL